MAPPGRGEEEALHPVAHRGFEQVEGASHIDGHIRGWILHRLDHTGTGRQTDDDFHPRHRLVDNSSVAHISDHQLHGQVVQILGPAAGKIVKHPNFFVLAGESPDKIRADEPGAAGY